MNANGSGSDEVIVEIRGLTLYTHFGVSEAEREVGQSVVVDMWISVPDTAATTNDRIDSTVDYGAVATLVARTFQGKNYKTLERAAAVAADAVLGAFGEAAAVQIRIAKPEPPIALAVDEVAVELTRTR